MLETFTIESFTPRIGEIFRVRPENTPPVEMKLSVVSNLTSHSGVEPDRLRRIPFSLLFHGPHAPLLPQHIYTVEHDELGSFDLFLVPLGPDQLGMRYEAIFT